MSSFIISLIIITHILIKTESDIQSCILQIRTGLLVFYRGFGVSNGRQVKELTKYFDGAIVGSAIVKSIATGESVEERINNLREKIKDLKSGL